MNELQVFEFESQKVRIIDKDGNPWFVAKDVCDILGIQNARDAIQNFPANEKAGVVINYVSSNGVKQNREANIVNEPGLYRLVFQSRKPEAEKFKRWVFHEVLPTLRKTGTYTVPGMEGMPKKPIPIGRMKETRLAYKSGIITVNEYRLKAFGLPPFEIDALPSASIEKIIPSCDLMKFVDDNIEFTESSEDFIRLGDLYGRYTSQVKKPLSRCSFILTLHGSFNLKLRQKRLGGYPTHCFIRCKLKEV